MNKEMNSGLVTSSALIEESLNGIWEGGVVKKKKRQIRGEMGRL